MKGRFVLAGCLALLLAGAARADDPPTVDILAALRLAPDGGTDGLASANSLRCTVLEGSPLDTFAPGAAVFLSALDRGSFRVVPDTEGVLACVVGETVHVLDFLSPRRALVGLGLEPRDEPIADRDRFSTRVVDPERLAAHGVASDGVGALATVYGRTAGRWAVSTFGREPAGGEVDAWAFYAPRAPLGELLERATVALDPATLGTGGRLLARVAEPSRLEGLGIRRMPPNGLVRLARGAGTAWTLTTLEPGFTAQARLDGLDAEALGLAELRLLDLPAGGSVRGRLRYAWKAAKAGFEGWRPRERVEVVREAGGGYLLRGLDPRRPVAQPLPGA